MRLVYDVKSVPTELGVANMIKIMEQHRVVFWDSDKGLKPVFYSSGETPAELLIVDTKDKEIDFEVYQRAFEDKVFWDKELFNCKNSPTYYYANYHTAVFPHTNQGIRKYLVSIGLKDLNITDSDKAQKAWADQKDKVAEATKGITIEFLKQRKEALDILRAEHRDKVEALEKILSDKVKLFDAKDEPLEDKKRIGNLVGRIKTITPVPEKYKEYRNKKRKWDSAMLFTTNYVTLLELYNEIRKIDNRGQTVLDSKSGKLV